MLEKSIERSGVALIGLLAVWLILAEAASLSLRVTASVIGRNY